MTDAQKIKLQRWWMEQLREITRRTMAAEDKRIEKLKKKNAVMLADLEIERKEDIDELYGYGTITEKQRNRLLDIFEQQETPDELYEAKIELLQQAYAEAHMVMHDMGQEV